MAAKRGFVKRTHGKRSPARSASWVLKRIDSWQRFHSSIPIKYKVPIVLISGYVLTLIIALILIGAILNLIIDQFETELQNKGFGGFSKLYTINKSTYESSLAKLANINLVKLSPIQEKIIRSLPDKLEELTKYVTNSDQLYQSVINRLHSLSSEINRKSFSAAFAEHRDTLAKLDKEILAADISFRAIDRLLKNKEQMEQYIFDTILPVNSYQLQCGDQGPQQNGWNKFGFKWELVKSDQPKYLYLGPFDDALSTEPDIYDFLSQLTIRLTSNGIPDFYLSPSSVTSFSDGFAIQLKLKEKLPYAPTSMVCGLWLRTE